jgi:hypothetical protein
LDTPILLIHFNRPDITEKAIEALKPVAPKRVWILCDAARAHKPGEAEKVAQVRAQLETLPWPCEIRRLYREENLGCFRNISDGITWFLKDCGGEGIILEDDCIADPSFFDFCAELLERYRGDPSVMAISGHTGRNDPFNFEGASYGFSNYFGCWGWATWQRAWEQFDPELTGWHDRKRWKQISHRVLPNAWARFYWDQMFKRVADGRRDSWAYRHLLSVWKVEGRLIIPKDNLVRNIGTGEEATHGGQADQSNLHLKSLHFPLVYPAENTIDLRVDRYIENHVHSKSVRVRLSWICRKLLGK